MFVAFRPSTGGGPVTLLRPRAEFSVDCEPGFTVIQVGIKADNLIGDCPQDSPRVLRGNKIVEDFEIACVLQLSNPCAKMRCAN